MPKQDPYKLERQAVADELQQQEDQHDELVSLVEDKVSEKVGEIPVPTNGEDGKDGYTPVKGKDYFDGEDGKDYVLTDADKKQIASEITVPIVEKVIERTETIIKETPIIKTEIREVPVVDEKKLKLLEKKIDELSKVKPPVQPIVRGASSLRQLTDVRLDNVIQDAQGNYQLGGVQGAGLATITVGTTQPPTPTTGDLWVDTN
jgi:hypothetical protein